MDGAPLARNESTNSGDEQGAARARSLTGLDLAVDHRPLDRLIPYARNARTHSEAQVAQIAASIREWGWTNPILVDGENGVVAGHGRLLAARKLGLATVPVIALSGLSEADKRAYVIADNRLALNAGWDEALLAAEVADLTALGVDLGLAGFEAAEIDDLLAGESASPFPDAAPPPPERPVTRPGDLWRLGEHRLLCGDATQVEDLRRVLGGGLADLVFTDPPYNVAYEGKTKKKLTLANDDLGRDFPAFLGASCRAMLSVTKGALYI